jgi:hypothetical protein
MAVERPITIRCDIPDCDHRMTFGLIVDTVAEARRRSKRAGWANRDKQDLCPRCAVTTDLRR